MPVKRMGLTPMDVWDQQRLRDIKKAIIRCVENNQPIPIEWVEEYNELVRRNEQ